MHAVNLVNATYSSPTGHALVGSRIYIPAEQLADADTRQRMGIPAGQKFATKPPVAAVASGRDPDRRHQRVLVHRGSRLRPRQQAT